MGENGTFRTSFSGFHKGDVLNYIDSLQARQAEETASLREAVRQAEERAGAAEEKLAVVLGTEGDGLCSRTIADCDYVARIPMAHGVDSLNVAAASAVAFWQLRAR